MLLLLLLLFGFLLLPFVAGRQSVASGSRSWRRGPGILSLFVGQNPHWQQSTVVLDVNSAILIDHVPSVGMRVLYHTTVHLVP